VARGVWGNVAPIGAEEVAVRHEATWKSVSRHAVPDWSHDAKLGIFVHWGLYSVPGWAPLPGEAGDRAPRGDWADWFANNPYAEWYYNSIRIEGSPSHQHHMATYGADFSYDRFVPLFNQATQEWVADDWAELFRKAGARYVVLTTKHHDGFLLWPSRHPNPKKQGYQVGRDLVGELTEAVRARGLRMGLYYSGGIDWTFKETVIRGLLDLLVAVPQQAEYIEYANHHWYELVERYEPAILWNDIAYPAEADLARLFADYYNCVPDGLVNDRFQQSRLGQSWLLRSRRIRSVLGRLVGWAMTHSRFMLVLPTGRHCDFRTVEYASLGRITRKKWEATRGIGHSFGFNRNEGPEDCLTLKELVHSFADIVSKNGNLLLNVGPMADGTIPDLQRERLLGLGRWLGVNGQAIFGTRPWVRAEGRTSDGTGVRFTQKGDAPEGGVLFAIVLGPAKADQVTLRALSIAEGAAVRLLGYDQALDWRQDGNNLMVRLPRMLPGRLLDAPAYVLSITPRPYR